MGHDGALLGVGLIALTDQPTSLACHFHDTTVSRVDPPSATHVINGACTDISKRRVERAMVAAFGYGTGVDPTAHIAPMVERSDRSAAHDGVVIVGPVAVSQPGKVCQIVVDNEVEPGIVEDLHAAVVAKSLPVVVR